MKIKTLLFPICALLAVSTAAASNTLFSEDWSEYALGDSPFGTNWNFSIGNSNPFTSRFVVEEAGSPARRVVASRFEPGDNFLGYMISKDKFALGKGVSLDVTLSRAADATNYVRLVFLLGNHNGASTDNFYHLDIQNGAFNVGRVGTLLTPGDISYSSVGGTSPVSGFVTYTFQMFEENDVLTFRVYSNGVLMWQGVDNTANPDLDFKTNGVRLMIGPRSGLNYIGDVELTAIPEPSHFALSGALLAVVVAGLIRRRHRA